MAAASGATPHSSEAGAALGDVVAESELAARLAALRQRLSGGGGLAAALGAARREAAEALAAQDAASGELALAQRRRRLAADAQGEAEKALAGAEAALKAKRRTCEGLRRTLDRLHEDLGAAAQAVADGAAAAERAGGVEAAFADEATTLEQEAAGLGDMQEGLRRRAAAERDKRLRLKACARARLQRDEDGLEALRAEAGARDAEAAALRERAAAQRASASAAEVELGRRQAERAEAEVRLQGRRKERKALYLELLHLRRAHEQMRRDTSAVDEELARRARRRGDARRAFCLEHIGQVTARIALAQRLDEDVVVAEAEKPGMIASIAGA